MQYVYKAIHGPAEPVLFDAVLEAVAVGAEGRVPMSRRVPPVPASFVEWGLDDCAASTDAAEALLRSIDLDDPGLEPEVLRLAGAVRARIEARRREVRDMRDLLETVNQQGGSTHD